MSIKIDLGLYYASEEIPSMLFDNSDEADLFDLILIGYINNPKAIEEFKKAESHYPSDYAIQYAIDNKSFIQSLTGTYSDILIANAENMTAFSSDTLADDDPYTPVFNYIRSKLNNL